MRAAQDGDQSALDRLLREVTPLLRRVVARRWHEPQDREDIVQEVLISVYMVRHTYDPERPFLPWLLTICRRRIADMARSSKRRFSRESTVDVMPEPSPDYEQDSLPGRSDDQEAIRQALSRLSAGHRKAIELTKLKGMSLQEASAATGKSVGSLKISVHRAMKLLRRFLDQKA